MKKIETSDSLVSVLTAGREAAIRAEGAARQERERLEQALRMARGTRDGVEAPPEAQGLETILRERGPLEVGEIARAMKVPVGRIHEELKRLRRAGKVAAVEGEDGVGWIWRVGDGGDTTDLKVLIARVIEHAPQTLAALEKVTGARRNRISGALVKLQVAGRKVRNLGTRQRAVWSIRR